MIQPWTRVLLLCLGACFCVLAATAQPRNIRLDTPGSNPEEVSIAINPLNPDNLIAGANLRYVYASFDGGVTWTQDQLPFGTWGDPCVLFDKTGRAYIANLTYGWDAITVRYSDDGGRTWSRGVKLYGPSSDSARAGSFYNSSLQDKEWLATDMTNSPWSGAIYAAWTDFTKYGSENPQDSTVIVFARSTDRGESFEPFVRVSDTGGDAVDSDNTVEGAVPAVGAEGEVYLTWAGPRGLYFDRSLDGGQTWGEDRVISDMPGGWDIDISGISRANGLPITVADISTAPTRGTVYVNWVDSRNGDHDVFILSSTDQGQSWRGPVRVNDDAVGNGKEQFFTWATVDAATGTLYVVFYDRRRYESDSTDVYLATSTDGGLTFVNERISEAIFYPTPMVFFGDYNGISAHNGRVRPIWTQLDQGQLSIHTCLIDTNPNSVSRPGDAPGMALDVWPNPVSMANGAKAVISLSMHAPGAVSAAVYDAVGRRVHTLHEGRLARGTHPFTWSTAAVVPGVYLVRVGSVDAIGTQRIHYSTRLIVVM
ncbi:MAG TPA: glycosyl hydrolase [Bacteroidota bacterium]|nr:glycosyl hydrolase [Bacteroidota bacterium]